MAEPVSDALLKLLGESDGFYLERVETEAARDYVFGAPAPRLVLSLRAKPDVPKRCSQCGAIVEKIHDMSERRVRDLPLGEWDTWLVFPRARPECPEAS
jgi:transposase